MTRPRRSVLTATVGAGTAAVVWDALLTAHHLAVPGRHERWGPMVALMGGLGVTGGLVVASLVAVALMVVLAVAAVRARPTLASGAALVLGLAVAVRCWAVVSNLQVH